MANRSRSSRSRHAGQSANGASSAKSTGAVGADSEGARHFAEQFAQALTTAGMQRMQARVFTALLASQQERMTAAELAEALQISPAAVSGAVRYLVQIGFIQRGRAPGERRDHYFVGNDFWYETVVRQDHVYRQLARSLDQGIAVLGAETLAGKRVAETKDFFEYLGDELPRLVQRWREERANK